LRVLERRGEAIRVSRPFGAGDAWIAARDTAPWSPER